MIFTIQRLTPVLLYLWHFGTIFLICTVRCSSSSSTHSLFHMVTFFKQFCWKVAPKNFFMYTQTKHHANEIMQHNWHKTAGSHGWTWANLTLCVQKYCISLVFRYSRMWNINSDGIWSVPTYLYLWIAISTLKALGSDHNVRLPNIINLMCI